MQVQCIESHNSEIFIIGRKYDAMRYGVGRVLIMQDELVSDFNDGDEWIGYERISFVDGSRDVEIPALTLFRWVM